MAAIPQIQLDGIRDAVDLVVRRAEQLHQAPPPLREYLARRVVVDKAGDFMELLALTIDGVPLGGEVSNRVPLLCINKASHLLHLVKDVVVPYLLLHPTAPAYLNLLEACAAGVRVQAVAAGGSFSEHGRALAHFADQFVFDARNHPLHAPDAVLRAAVEELRRRTDTLLRSTCTVRHQQAAVGAADADQLGGAQEMEGGAAAQGGAEAEAAAAEAQGGADEAD